MRHDYVISKVEPLSPPKYEYDKHFHSGLIGRMIRVDFHLLSTTQMNESWILPYIVAGVTNLSKYSGLLTTHVHSCSIEENEVIIETENSRYVFTKKS